MKTKLLILTTISLALFSCVKLKDNPAPPEDPSIVDGAIPNNFDWKTIKTFDLTVNVEPVNASLANDHHIIKVYNSPLLSKASLIATGAARPDNPFTLKISVSSPTETIYIHQTKPNGLATLTPVTVNSQTVNTTLTKSSGEEPITLQSDIFGPNVVASLEYPDLTMPSEFDQIINDNSSAQILGFNTGESSAHGNTYKSYLIPEGFTRTSSIDFGNYLEHAVLYVKGSLNINANVSLNKASIVIMSGGSVNIKGLSTGVITEWFPAIYVEEGGSINTSSAINVHDAVFVNKGTFVSGKKLTVNTNGEFYNDGILTVANSGSNDMLITNSAYVVNTATINAPKISVSSNATVTNAENGVINVEEWYQTNGTELSNHGEIAATVKFGNSGGGTIYNYCKITSELSDIQSLTAYLESGSIWISQQFKANNSEINMYGGSMFLTGEIESIYGLDVTSPSPNYSLFKVTGDIPNLTWAASSFTGKVELVFTGLTAANRPLYEIAVSGDAILTDVQTQDIPGTDCNGSLGQLEEDDDPGTGEPGSEPVFESYFPSQSGWGTYAFEDLWPSKGDYDLNDMVFKFRVTYISNSSNEVTQMILDYNILAVGATKTAGVAVQLDNVQASNIASVTGQTLGSGAPFSVGSNGTEPGVNLAVIPLFNSAKDLVSYPGFLNTILTSDYISTPMEQIVVTFNSPVDQSLLTMDAFNMFISIDERGKEIHLPGYSPTSKFNTELTAGRSLHPNDIFKYNDGMMWGLMFPVEFSHPIEKASITEAYTHFSSWATSGGTQYPDWYQDKEGYRNNALIF